MQHDKAERHSFEADGDWRGTFSLDRFCKWPRWRKRVCIRINSAIRTYENSCNIIMIISIIINVIVVIIIIMELNLTFTVTFVTSRMTAIMTLTADT
jgi:hypothetical protein